MTNEPQNVTVFDRGCNGLCVEWTDDTARYHFWLHGTDAIREIYKNPRDPGYFVTRKLDVNAAKNIKMLAAVMEVVERNKLVEAAKAKAKHIEQERLQRIVLEQQQQRVHAYGPGLLATLRSIVQQNDNFNGRAKAVAFIAAIDAG